MQEKKKYSCICAGNVIVENSKLLELTGVFNKVTASQILTYGSLSILEMRIQKQKK